ncbi:MAG TPA: hypothetical protein VGN20_07175 [Mucilaginibacter sp.]|jgi:hypothetical protein
MKSIIFYTALLSCFILGCKKKEKLSLIGVYKLESQSISGGGTDSTDSRTQIKIYTADHFIYAGMTPDSAVAFGVGTYKPDTGDRIIEHEFFSSARQAATRNFNVDITQHENGYSQKIPDIAEIKGVKYALKEDYSKLQNNDTSKLDGLWKMEKAYWLKGKDTVKNDNTQYKIFFGGHFLYIHSIPADKTASKFTSGFGYGTFSFKGDTIIEEDKISNDALVLNRKFTVKAKFNGNDEYTQVIDDPKNNQQSVEVYTRVK